MQAVQGFGFRVQRLNVLGSQFSPDAGRQSGQFDRKRNCEKANIEYRILNVECRMSKQCILSILKKTEQSDSTLRNSAVRYSIFCGSLFQTCVVSYEFWGADLARSSFRTRPRRRPRRHCASFDFEDEDDDEDDWSTFDFATYR